jgi:hypothetical protein
MAVEPINLGGVGRVVDDELLDVLQMLAHRDGLFDAAHRSEELAVAVQPIGAKSPSLIDRGTGSEHTMALVSPPPICPSSISTTARPARARR